VKLPGPAGPPGATERRRRGGGGCETTRSCTHGGEHHLTEASDECRAAPLVDLTCTHILHIRTQRFSFLLSVCECRVLFPLHTQTGVRFLIGMCVCTRARVCVCVCVYVCARARVCIPCVNWRGTFFAFYLSVCKLLVKIFFSFYSDTSKSVILACVICKLVWHVFYLCVRSVTHVYALLRSHTDSLTLIWMRNGVAYSFISVAII